MNKMYLVLGDWSKDGHGKTTKVLISTNKTVKEVQQAYKDSCKLTGVQFNHNESYTGNENRSNEEYQICTDYEDGYMSYTCATLLGKHGDLSEICGDDYDEETGEVYLGDESTFTEFWFWFVSLSLKDFEWKILTEDAPCINGYWSNTLNHQFGYGIM